MFCTTITVIEVWSDSSDVRSSSQKEVLFYLFSFSKKYSTDHYPLRAKEYEKYGAFTLKTSLAVFQETFSYYQENHQKLNFMYLDPCIYLVHYTSVVSGQNKYSPVCCHLPCTHAWGPWLLLRSTIKPFWSSFVSKHTTNFRRTIDIKHFH